MTAKIINGVAYAPSQAPAQVQRAIWAGNDIRHKPYIYGGGHASFKAAGYDCSGSVSYVLHAAGLIKTPMDSSDFMGWGDSGLGDWITVYANPGHAFVEIAGIRLDTSREGDLHAANTGTGPRWHPLLRDTSSYTPRHPDGF
jgi:cell wall-associated NlpC family hydrolase